MVVTSPGGNAEDVRYGHGDGGVDKRSAEDKMRLDRC